MRVGKGGTAFQMGKWHVQKAQKGDYSAFEVLERV